MGINLVPHGLSIQKLEFHLFLECEKLHVQKFHY